MNLQRQELERRLPPPSPLLCSYLWEKTNEAGLPLGQDDIVFLARLFGDYVQNTAEGKRTVIKVMGASVKPADVRHAYHLFTDTPGTEQRLDYKDLFYYGGWVYKGSHGLAADQVEVERNGNMEICESTGITGPSGYCVLPVKDYDSSGREVLTPLSNYARLHSTNQKIRDTASQATCTECPVKACSYHPKHETSALKLVSTDTVYK